MTVDGDPVGHRPRVALVAYFFPPIGGVAAARTMGFVRHLPAAGWEPVVIASRGSAYGLVDRAAEAALPRSLEVHRGLAPEPGHLRAAIARLPGILRSTRAAVGAPATRSSGPDPTGSTRRPVDPPAGQAPALRRAVRAMPARIRRGLWFPDDQAGWFPFAVLALIRAHRREPLDVLLSSSSPVTAHLVAGAVSRLYHIPWVADFRDPWLGSPVDPPTGRFDQWRRRRLEAWIARRADRMVFATPGLRLAYASRYPSRAWRCVTVENGYESSELQGLPRRVDRDAGPRRLVYAGSLYRPAELDIFLTGLRRFLDRSPVARERIAVSFIGATSPECRAVADAHLADPVIGRVVGFLPFMPRGEALGRLAEADAALTLLGPGPGMDVFVGAKLFDALGLGLQVVAMLPPGDARAVLASLDWGIVADPTPDSVADALGRFIDGPLPSREADPGRRYDRATLAARLARLLDDVIDRGTDSADRDAHPGMR